MLEIVTKVIGWIIQVLPIFITLRPRPPTYASTSPLLLLQLHQQQQMLSIINKFNSTNHHLQHAKRTLLQHLIPHAAYERSGGPPKRPAAKRPCNPYASWGLCSISAQNGYGKSSCWPWQNAGESPTYIFRKDKTWTRANDFLWNWVSIIISQV